jgi:hypothetical protein
MNFYLNSSYIHTMKIALINGNKKNIEIPNSSSCYNLPNLKMELDIAQRPTDKRKTRRDRAEIGSNADAALLPVGAAAGSVDRSSTEGVVTPGASADGVGEYAGERLTPTKLFLCNDSNSRNQSCEYLNSKNQISKTR